MDTIRQYINSLFINITETEETEAAKAHLMEMAEDKYNELRDEGMGIDEAIAKVIAEIGNLDELGDEIALKEETVTDAPVEEINVEQVKQILDDYHKGTIFAAVGIAGFCLSILPYNYMNGPLALILTLTLLAMGVIALIVQRFLRVKWYDVPHGLVNLNNEASAFIKEEQQKQEKKLLALKCLAAVLIIFSIVPLAYIRGRESFIYTALMIAAGAGLLTYAICEERTYGLMMQKDPYAKARQNTTRIIGLAVLVVVGLALGLFTYQFWLTLIILGAAFAIWWFTRR